MMKTQTNNWMTIGKSFAILLCMGLALFVALELRSWWQGPTIYVDTPHAGALSNSPLIRLRGHTAYVAQLYLNGGLLPISLADQSFVAEIPLPIGESNITLDGYSRSGRHTRTVLPIIYQPEAKQVSAVESALTHIAPKQDKFNPDGVFQQK